MISGSLMTKRRARRRSRSDVATSRRGSRRSIFTRPPSSDTVLRRRRQSLEHLAPQFGRHAVGEPPLKGEGNKGAGIEQPAAFVARDGGNRLLVDRVVH